jgi:hypothetical protein
MMNSIGKIHHGSSFFGDRSREKQDEPMIVNVVETEFDNDDLDSAAFENNNDHVDKDEMVRMKTSLKIYGTLFGWLIGVFIQCSSLGANQFLIMNNNNSSSNSNNNWCRLLWSFATSAMGVAAFWLLRKTIPSAVTNYSSFQNLKLWNNDDDDDEEQERLQMTSLSLLALDPSYTLILDVCFSMGALAGVCMAWMVTDVAVLGWSSRHSWHSAIAFTTSIVACHILVRYWFHPQPTTTTTTTIMSNTNGDLEQPLLPKHKNDGFIVIIPNSHQHHSTETTTTTMTISSSLRPITLVLGGLVGSFIQFSSLGANFLSEQLHLDSDQALIFSVIWSVWASTMGIGNLIVIRRILALFLEVSDSLLAYIECCFAIGATLGLNAARTVTDVAMGLEMNLTQIFVTLLGTLLWCRLIFYCYGQNP